MIRGHLWSKLLVAELPPHLLSGHEILTLRALALRRTPYWTLRHRTLTLWRPPLRAESHGAETWAVAHVLFAEFASELAGHLSVFHGFALVFHGHLAVFHVLAQGLALVRGKFVLPICGATGRGAGLGKGGNHPQKCSKDKS